MTPTGHTPLMFDWVQDHRRRLALWIFVALLLHFGGYFLFRVVQPPASPVPALDHAVHVLPPGSAEAIRLAAFVEAHDPSIVAADRIGSVSIPDPSVPGYRPSYATAPPPLAPLPDPQPRLLPPIVRDVGAIPMPNPASTLVIPPPARDTQVALGGDLAERTLLETPKWKFPEKAGGLLPPAVFLVAVDEAGRVVHVFEQESSGNRHLDSAAARRLFELRFTESPGRAWGTATFHWGAGESNEPSE